MNYIGSSQNPILRIGHAHLWSTSLLVGPNELAEYQLMLSSEELDRAARFYFEHDRRRYIAARGQLRLLLGHYTDTPPEDVVITVGAHGKPYLASPSELVHFNVSHAGDRALVAFCPDGPVGVDLELMKRETWLGEIAETFCTPRELAGVRARPAEQQAHELLRLWTAKEAFLKALGKGLQVPLDEVEIIDPSESFTHPDDHPDASHLNWKSDPSLSDFFQLQPLPCYERSGYAASLVTLKGVTCTRLFWHRFRRERLLSDS